MRKAQADERREAFDRMLRPVIDAGYNLAFGMLQNRAEAEDVLQDAAFSAWRNFAGFRQGAKMRPWFLAIVANRCRTVRRSRWWSVLKLSEPRAVADVATDGVIQSEDIRRALGRIKHDRRLAIVLHFYLDLPFEEVAAVLGISTEEAKSRVYRAVRELRPILEIAEVAK